MDVTIIVATFGSETWEKMGKATANNAYWQFNLPVLNAHGTTLHETRNDLAAQAKTEWLCFLDADDELSVNYFNAMEKGTGDLLAPAVLWLEDGMPAVPVTLGNRDMRVANQCVIGTLIRKEKFEDIGGFWGERGYEDWSLFRRAWLTGSTIQHLPEAVYIVNVSKDSRNNTIDNPQLLCKEITVSHREWMRHRKR